MSFGVWIENEVKFGMEKRIEMALDRDDVDLFIWVTCRMDSSIDTLVRGQEFLMKSCKYRAIKCATALLNGETPFIFDVNQPTPAGYFPIHHAAHNCDAGMVELLLYHGARTDVRSAFLCNDEKQYHPLHAVMHFASCSFGDYAWDDLASLDQRASAYQLVTLVCLQRCRRVLQCVELLAWKTDTFFSDFLWYASKGNLLFLAILLAVARDKVVEAIDELLLALNSDSAELRYFPLCLSEADGEKLKLLISVFMKAGYELETYIKKKKYGVTEKQISDDVACLLKNAGFIIDSADTDLSSLRSPSVTNLSGDDPIDVFIDQENEDVGMEHFQTSGHRWGEENRSTRCEVPSVKPNRPFGKYEITEEQKKQLRTVADKAIPIPIPCFVDCSCTAAQYIKSYKPKDAATVAPVVRSTQRAKRKRQGNAPRLVA